MLPTLPNEILNMIAIELREARDFTSLYHFSRVNKQFAAIGLSHLYRICDLASTHYQAAESLDRTSAGGRKSWAYRGLVLRASLEMSTFPHGTIFPYARYLRVLNLQDLVTLLEEIAQYKPAKRKLLTEVDKAIRKNPAIHIRDLGTKNDIHLDVRQHGDLLIPYATQLEEIGGPLTVDHLTDWLPQLPSLETIRVYDGSPLYHVKQLILEHCPEFKNIFFVSWSDMEQSDEKIASIFELLAPRGLRSIEIVGSHLVGPLSVQALAQNNNTLTSLKLGSGAITRSGFNHLPKLGVLNSLHTLELSFTYSGNLSEDEYLEGEIGQWIQSCKNLHSLSLANFQTVVQMLEPLLESDNLRLRRLRVHGGVGHTPRRFYDVLNGHQTLRELMLEYHPTTERDFSFEPELLCNLSNLRVLSLLWVSEHFDNARVCMIPDLHPKLEELSLVGDKLDDGIWGPFACLEHLRKLTIVGNSFFSCEGISQFLDVTGDRTIDLDILSGRGETMGTSRDINKLKERFTAAGGIFQFIYSGEDDESDWSEEDD